jgi:uncharacterized phage protein gp47/JayE
MSFDQPTLPELIQKNSADIEARFPGGGVYRRRSVLGAKARTQAGDERGMRAFLSWIARQIMIDTADQEVVERDAAIHGMDYLDATAAEGPLIVSGLSDAPLPALTSWQGPNGLVYVLDEGVVLAGTVQTVTVRCETVGAAGNLLAGATLTLVNPVSGIVTTAVVDADGITGGAAGEDLESLRERVIDRKRKPPRGGAKSDYEAWAKEAHPDVDQVWVSHEQGDNIVSVRFSTFTGPIPSSGVVTAVADYIETVRPVTASPQVLAPIAQVVNFSISLLPDTPEVRANVEAELRGLMQREGRPSGRIYSTRINEVISGAAGELDHDMTVPSGDVVSDYAHLPVFGVITWL